MLRRACLTILSLSLILSTALATPTAAQPQAALELVDIIDVGGTPKAIVVDNFAGRNEIIFYDAASSRLKFLDGDTLSLGAETIHLPTWGFDYWLVYDHYYHRAYFPAIESATNIYNQQYYAVTVNVIANRQVANSFLVNETYNHGVADPPDTRFGMNGVAFKQPFSEGDNPGRLIIDNAALGNLDVVDIQGSGAGAILRQRFSYRAPTASGWNVNHGNSLALETNHETRSVDDLLGSDTLYIADKNADFSSAAGYGLLQRVQFAQYPHLLDASLLAPVDLNATWPFMNGVQGLEMSPERDRLYVATGIQSFDTGYIGVVNTTQQSLAQTIAMTYADPGFVHVDWYDQQRIFVTTFDGFYNDPTQSLYLKLYYNEALVDTLPLFAAWDELDGPHGMAFDPYTRRLYLTVDGYIVVVQVNYGAEPAPPAAISASAVIPPTGGELLAPGGRATITFPDGAFDQPALVAYSEDIVPPGSELFMVQAFDLSAVISGTATAITGLNQSASIVIPFTDLNAGPVYEQTLGLYFWDGARWILEPSTVSYLSQEVRATVDHLSLFAVLGQSERLFLPNLRR